MKRSTPTILTLLLSVSGGAAQAPTCPDGDRKLPVFGPQDVIVTCVTPRGTHYVPSGPDWRKTIENYEALVAQFHAAQKKRLQGAVPVVLSADRNRDDLLRSYPFLKKEKILDDDPAMNDPSDMHVRVAESRAHDTSGNLSAAKKKTGVNLLFVSLGGSFYCGTGGCAFYVYADSGTGYKKVMDDLLWFPEAPIRVSRAADGGVSLFFFSPHLHAPDGRPPVEIHEYILRGNSLEETEPPKQPPGQN